MPKFPGSAAAAFKVLSDSNGSRSQLEVERVGYLCALGLASFITKLLAIHDDMIVLEHLQNLLRKRLQDLMDASQVPPTGDTLRWTSQVPLALEHAHAYGVMQVYIGTPNMILD